MRVRIFPIAILGMMVAVGAAMFVMLNDANTADPNITYGPVENIEGVLTATGISLVRRGTHVLYIDDTAMYLVESSVLNLQQYANRTVFISSGTLQPNISKNYLPLLTVTSIAAVDDEGEMKELAIPSLSMTLSAPETWTPTIEDGVVRFRLADVSDPILTVESKDDITSDIPGAPFRIAGRSAKRISPPGTADIIIYIFNDDETIALRFTPPDKENAQLLSATFSRILSTITLSRGTSSPSAPTGTGSGLPCGGSAGVLCPSGYYCAISDATQNTGLCRSAVE